jgi:membrane-bound lytic murein transglycosylase A
MTVNGSRDRQEVERARVGDHADLRPLAYADLAVWPGLDHRGALDLLRIRADRPVPATGTLGIPGESIVALARAAAALGPEPTAAVARRFFETRFRPFEVVPRGEPAFLTGYFEPEIDGSIEPDRHFSIPLLAPPADLEEIDPERPPPGIPAGFTFACRTADGWAVAPDRAAIEDGALAGLGLELVHLVDPVDAYFAHVQGSVRVRLAGGGELRLAHAARSGHPYRSIGRLAVARGLVDAEAMTGETLRALLTRDPAAGRALMRENPSFVFFRRQTGLDPMLGVPGAAGVPLSPGRSLAVDRRRHTYGTPILIEADLPTGPEGGIEPFAALMSADDTGSAIVGAARGDVFVGIGREAGIVAGRFRHPARRFVVLVPEPEGAER